MEPELDTREEQGGGGRDVGAARRGWAGLGRFRWFSVNKDKQFLLSTFLRV